MPNPNAHVSLVLALDPPVDTARPVQVLEEGRGVSVELEQGRRPRLDPADPRARGYAQILEGVHRLRVPIYFELDPDRGTIAHLLIPVVDRVAELLPGENGAILVRTERSHALMMLPADSADFAAFEAALRAALGSRATIVVTVDDTRGIIDVREPGPDWPRPPVPGQPIQRGPSLLKRWVDCIWRWPFWPWWWFGCISFARAQQVFGAMQATSCAPLTVPVPCIPFLYPDDGCFARAHEMCRLMIAMSLSPRKVWIRGNLRTPTRNNPNCFVRWGWHVAPTLCVRGPWFWSQRTMVIDPSLFTAPVSPATWKSVQGDPAATLDYTDASLYFHVGGDVYDPGYVLTNQDLATYRLRLQLRATQVGPPPYANCP
jgi:hypothetical protein